MEGADPIVDPGEATTWRADGFRIVSLAHYGKSRYAHGTSTVGPLTAAGRELLPALEREGIVLDVTHLCDESFWDALDRWGGGVVATHSNCRALCPGERQFDDEQLRALIERGAVIGAVVNAWMLKPGFEPGVTSVDGCTLAQVVDHIDHVCHLAGNARHAAIGSDLDGGYGLEECPEDMDTIADLARIPDMLAARGYSAADIALISHGNWLRALSS
jgi:membrane dipeptidase